MPEVIPQSQVPNPVVPTEGTEIGNGAAPTPEAEKAKASPDSARFAALSRKERELVRRSRAIQAKEREIQQREQQFQPWKEASELAKQNRIEAVKRLGISYEDLTQDYLAQTGSLTPEQVAERKAQAIVDERFKTYHQEQIDAQARAQEAQLVDAMNQIRAEATELVNTSEDFPVLKQTKQFDAVGEYIKLIFEQEKRILPIEVATREVEQFLEEQALEIAKIPKLRSKLLPPEEAPKPESQAPAINPQSKTLTHKATTVPPASQPRSAEERKKRAMEIFYGR